MGGWALGYACLGVTLCGLVWCCGRCTQSSLDIIIQSTTRVRIREHRIRFLQFVELGGCGRAGAGGRGGARSAGGTSTCTPGCASATELGRRLHARHCAMGLGKPPAFGLCFCLSGCLSSASRRYACMAHDVAGSSPSHAGRGRVWAPRCQPGPQYPYAVLAFLISSSVASGPAVKPSTSYGLGPSGTAMPARSPKHQSYRQQA